MFQVVGMEVQMVDGGKRTQTVEANFESSGKKHRIYI